MDLEAQLLAGLDEWGICWQPTQITQALSFVDLMLRWNRIDNLTAITDPDQMVIQHLLDSLSIKPMLDDAETVLDVGSGAGLPGIPLAIFTPSSHFTLLDAAAKRTRFMRHAITQLDLPNVAIVQARLDQWQPDSLYDVIVSRAFSRAEMFAAQAVPLLQENGRLLAMKGKVPEDELSALSPDFKYTVAPLNVPGLLAQRHLVTITAAK